MVSCGRELALAGLCALLGACSAGDLTFGPPPCGAAEAALRAQSDPAAQLAERIPDNASSCVVSSGLALGIEQRRLLVLVSQTETVPWSIELPVEAYARARVRGDDDSRLVSWLQFAPEAGGPERIRVALDAAFGERLIWPGASVRCRDTTDCADTRVRFIAPLVVELESGSTEVELGPPTSSNGCAVLRREHPDALEVASWQHDPAFVSELSPRRTDQVLLASGGRLTKLRRRSFGDALQAERALRLAAYGADELPVVAGIPVRPMRTQQGLSLVEEVDFLWDDLRLLVADHQREKMRRASPGSPEHHAPLEDVDELREQARWMLRGLEGKPADERAEAARLLSGWLLRVRRQHPSDEGLAGVQYRLFIEELDDARSALSVAEQMVALGVGEVARWQLSRRRALSMLSARELEPALALAHGLPAKAAAAMARELVLAVKLGSPYERAEWGWLAARELSEAQAHVRRRRVDEVRVPLVTLPQTLAYLATRSPALRAIYGVHMWVSGSVRPGPLTTQVDAWAAVSRAGGKAPILVAAASSDQHEKLRELGTLLDTEVSNGSLRLGVSLRPLGGSGPEVHVVLEGEREGDAFVISRMDERSAGLDWDKLREQLAEPLSRLTGQTFPPDELRLPARDAEQAAQLVRWGESEEGVRCHAIERWAVCRGPMHDPQAALRALLRMGDQLLADESLRLWGRPTR